MMIRLSYAHRLTDYVGKKFALKLEAITEKTAKKWGGDTFCCTLYFVTIRFIYLRWIFFLLNKALRPKYLKTAEIYLTDVRRSVQLSSFTFVSVSVLFQLQFCCRASIWVRNCVQHVRHRWRPACRQKGVSSCEFHSTFDQSADRNCLNDVEISKLFIITMEVNY